jgi:hypothetical protein
MISPGEVAVFLTKANVEIANAAPNPLAPFIAGGGPVAEGFISPGQPLNINWTYWSFVGDRASVPQITVNIYGAAPSSLQFAASRLFSSGPVTYTPGGIAGQMTLTVDPAIPQSTDAAVKPLYRVTLGSKSMLKSIYMEVVNSAGQLMASAYYYFIVQLEDVGQWTAWNVNPPMKSGRSMAFPWNENYTIGASFTNQSIGILTFNGQASLQEAEVKTTPPTVFSPISAVSISNLVDSEPVQLDFTPIKKTWQWMLPFLWIATGDESKTFQYQIVYALSDQYGNAYQAISDPIRVLVAVSNTKLDYQMTAEALEITSLVLAALSWLITPVPSAAAAAAATGFGAAAKDPPSPSKKYRSVVTLPAQRVGRASKPELVALLRFFSLTQQFAESILCLYETEARILGALLARNGRATTLQKRSYVKNLRAMNVIAEEAYASAQESITIFDTWKEIDLSRMRRQIMLWKRRPATLEKLSIGRRNTNGLKKLATSDVSSWLADQRPSVSIQRAANRLIAAAISISMDRFRVMKLKAPPSARPR